MLTSAVIEVSGTKCFVYILSLLIGTYSVHHILAVKACTDSYQSQAHDISAVSLFSIVVY